MKSTTATSGLRTYMGGQAFTLEPCMVLRQMFSQSSKVANISTHKHCHSSSHGLGKLIERSAKADAVYANWPAGLGGTGNSFNIVTARPA